MARRLAWLALAGCSGTGSAVGSATIDRAAEWVAARVPYCQAANHQRDNDSSCPQICERPDNPAWDAYRSDCSGFVSWAWALPAPGLTTTTLAPFANDVTHAIEGEELRPGDAINNAEHVMLFEAWTRPGAEAKLMEEPGCSSPTPYAIEITAAIELSGPTVTVEGHGAFTAIRYRR